MTAKIIDGRKIGGEIKKQVSLEVDELISRYKIIPNITTIEIGDNPESNLYLELRDKACKEVGIESNQLDFLPNIPEREVINAIIKLNKDNNVHGIFIQFPLPDHISHSKLINILNPKKDVEGLTPYNMGRTLAGDENIIPITPLSVLTILEHENTNLKGKDVVIVNHSNLVGKPLVALFLNRNSTVSVCHVFTKNLSHYSSNADILVTATGIPKIITKDHVKKNAFVIDVGIVKTNEGVCGDVDFILVKEKAGKLTPVPGGVGPVTVACSLLNILKTFKVCVEEK